MARKRFSRKGFQPVPLIALRALFQNNLKVELQQGEYILRVGVHALACRRQGANQMRNPKKTFRTRSTTLALIA
jgi:hypothetical protein